MKALVAPGYSSACLLLTCLLTLHCILVLYWWIWKLFLLQQHLLFSLLPPRLHPRGSGLYCFRYVYARTEIHSVYSLQSK